MTNQEWMNRGQEVLMNNYGRFPIAMVKGKGSYVWDANNKQYLDMVGGIATCSLGHCPEAVLTVLKNQAQTLWHVSNLYWIPPQVELAEKLTASSGLDKAFFCNSGAEANEAAIKLARKYFYRKKQANKTEIIAFEHSFHGRTMGALTATGQTKYHEGFGPLVPGFKYVEYNNLPAVEQAITDNTCAIIVEPIQGEGGIHPADPTFLRSLRRICDQAGILLIFDEVQCGIGRTGTLFAYQQYGVTPHILTLAKGLGSGFPIGAMLATAEVATGFAPGDHAATFGGNPLATAVANQVIDIINQEEFLKGVKEKGQQLREGIQKINEPRIKEIRGRGLLIGVEFTAEVKELINICMKKGLLVVGAGTHVVRFVPPLTINQTEINQALAIFRDALQDWDA
ncbi:MAG TPA: acetylornithine transaminase [Syntrophomonadaceae bacterium]|nr:acetylornithine transaminase [Syntrophomonadaceae bacterium]HOQ10324.1 acetylornithine transaminase [Syntrophomonadaceae bacterium]HPU49753.1 acetylornithine transaminase [Syntrophomonadaceae bacterium]